MEYYLTTLLVYGGVDAVACLGLSQQFGYAGVTNFGFIIFQSVGAYVAAILSLPPESANGGFQIYVGGLHLPWPLPWIGAAVAGAVVALPFTFILGKRLRGDFAAIGLLVTALMCNLLVTNFRPLFNGAAGLSLVPQPFSGEATPQGAAYAWAYSAGAVVLVVAVYFFLRRVVRSPYGRTLRAMRDNDMVADSLGANLRQLRTEQLVLGGAIAGLSGGVLVGFITLWDPQAWGYAETIVLFAAVIIGGVGNHKGAVLGAILVPLGFEEATRYIPAVGPPGLIPALQWVAIGLLIVVFLWWRPQGILPERRILLSHAARAGRAMAASDGSNASGGPDRSGGPDASGGGDEPALLVTDGEGGNNDGSSTLGAPASIATWRRPGAVVRAERAPGPVLEAVELVRDFEGVRAVDGVSIAFPPGRLSGLIGPNGAGKSTLLAMLAGTLAPTSGAVRYLGEDVTAVPAFRRARAGLVRTFQLASEYKRLTVLENLLSAVPEQRGNSLRGALAGPRYWRAHEEANIARAEALVDQFGLTKLADTYAGELSGGQRRLVEIMRALMAEPTVLLLDEPMAGVHPHLAREIGQQLLGLLEQGLSIVMVEHELAIMDQFADPVFVMADGRLLAEGTMSQLRQRSEVVEAYLVG
jgi:branched-chain amino acid transport system permease protein